MSENIIFLFEKEKPDNDCMFTDEDGIEWYKYSCAYKSGIDTEYSFYIWAKSREDAEKRLDQIKKHAVVEGQIYSIVKG